MQRRHVAARDEARQRQVDEIDVEMHHVELGGALQQKFEQHHMIGDGVLNLGVEAQCGVAGGHQFGIGDRIPAREQGDIVALADEFLGQIGHNPLGAPVKPWRDTFIKGGNLRDLHRPTPDLTGRA